jgi:hypothetical protein
MNSNYHPQGATDRHGSHVDQPITTAVPSTLPKFNPSGDTRVDGIKGLTEQVFDYLRSHFPDNRERSLAITNYEQACMWAVKSLFTDEGKGY